MATPLFPIALAFCLGIVVSGHLSFPIPLLLLTSLFCLVISWLLFQRRKTELFLGVSLLTFLSLGLVWPPLYEAGYDSKHLKTLVRTGEIDLSQPCRIAGVCSKSSVRRGIGEQIEVDVNRIENRFSTFSTRGKIRLALYYKKGEELAANPVLKAGDRIEVLANLKKPKNFNNPGQFDYVSYLERQGVFLVGTIKNELLITKLASNNGPFLIRIIQNLRAALSKKLETTFGDSGDVTAALKALLLGEKQGLASKVEENFRATGIYHVLVVSGQHVAIMAGFLFALFKMSRFPMAFTVVLTFLGLGLYSFITEGQPSIVRATLMTCIFLLVLIFDRNRNLLNSLSLAGLTLLLVDPFWLLDPGFQLSFLAVLAIGLIGLPLLSSNTQPYRNALWQIEEAPFDAQFSPKMADFRISLRLKIERLRNFFRLDFFNISRHAVIMPLRILLYLMDVLFISLAVQLLFFLLMILYFHRVSLISIFLNVLVVPLVGLIVPLGFLFLLCSFIFPMASPPIGEICGILTRWLLQLAETFADSSWGNYRISSPPAWLVILYLLSLSLFLLVSKRSVRALCALVTILALILLLTQPFKPAIPPSELQLTFLDVRQGDSIFLRFPDYSTLLVDGGGLLGRSFGEDFSEETFDVGEQVVSPFLWSMGVKSLDAVVLTHAHHDHMGGLHAILSNFQVKEIWLGENPYTPEYLRLLKKAIAKSVIVRNYGFGDELTFHGAQIYFLNPVKGQNLSATPSNNDSLAFRLKFGSRTFLLTGDIEKKMEYQIISQTSSLLASDVLKVAHHGSRSSTTSEFLDRVNPVLSIISVAEHSPFGHPHNEVLSRLKQKSIQLFRTDQNGAITVYTDGNQLRVKTYLE